ncbi:type III PLP-dependent enzyme [Treponema phagedenis]|uniref:ornithine decarboxylase n=1 Tax=Treponema phagedenis TaxID=162 RepID=A0A0B7GQF9_TREPH|nr:type III PLP-dependent enzyme [Treponema phagedenis]NVP24542.1 type III PLP-dependent enzyme [Treponema phagedenis]QEJ94762.1 type III PLP-dependent enzyme [Treponema phagedenis]QEJ97699.1 type III PLP-dependent enzyme [Treponema phagedenis]QEK00668.1 type III PLP-dependent enzyme [Treponema phagedenis]QEK03267.1 type III PLP-dependent enzyme [Treponema phagedenis]
MHITDYMSEKNWKKVLDFSEKLQTPCVIINLEKIKKNYLELKQLFPDADIYYAMKANPHEEILKLLIGLGANFDIASRYELDKILSLGVPPECLSYGNTIKKAKDIAYFYEKGVRLFATDSKEDLKNLAKYAPQSRVFVRILVENTNSADWPLSRKFGCHPDMAYDLCVLAKEMGLIPYGISFHVGSQQRDIGQWDDAIAKTKYLMRSLEEEEDIKLEMINMGGGFPAPYITPTNKLSEYAREITRYLDDDFGNEKPHIILEPGRSLVGDSGVLVTEIITISRKNNTALHRWVYVDAGVFNGLTETLNENIKYPIFTSKDESAGKWGEVVLAGPTCDSMDIMYEDYKYTMPISLKSGDRLYFLSAGAYTASYASVEFNGFPPIQTYIME